MNSNSLHVSLWYHSFPKFKLLLSLTPLLFSSFLVFETTEARATCTNHCPGEVVSKLNADFIVCGDTVPFERSQTSVLPIPDRSNNNLKKTITISCNESAMKKWAQFISFICVLMKIMACKIKLHYSLSITSFFFKLDLYKLHWDCFFFSFFPTKG